MTSFKGKGKIYYLTSEIVQMWKDGLNKTWLNYLLKVPYVIGISGDYAYWIRVSNPVKVSFSDVPEFYVNCVNPKKQVYRYDAFLEKTEKREIHKKKSSLIKQSVETGEKRG